MKKFLKIFGITLASLVALVLLVVGIACYVVFSPKHLTPIVNRVADSLLTCPHELEEVNLTFFRTFPHFGVEVKGLYVINPMDGAQSDTLLAAPDVLVDIDIKQYLDSQILDIRELRLSDVALNPFIDKAGETNFNILNLPKDTTEDTTATVLPFDIRLHRLTMNAKQLSFVDVKDSLDFRDLALRVSALAEVDSLLHINATIEDFLLDWNGLQLTMTGTAAMAESITMNLNAAFSDWTIAQVLQQLPERFASMVPKEIYIAGTVSATAHVFGEYADKKMPLVDATVSLKDATAKYEPLPYTISGLAVNADAHIDLNKTSKSQATIKHLAAKTKNTRVTAKGKVSELLDDMTLDLQIGLDANLPDFAYFLPENLKADGRAKGDVSAKIKLSDLTDMALEKGHFAGKLQLDNLNVLMDSMSVALPSTLMTFQIPNTKPSWKKLNWLDATFALAKMDFSDPGIGMVNLGQSDLHVELGNVLQTMPVLYANVDLKSSQRLVVNMDTIRANIDEPHVTAYTEFDTKDTTRVPIFNTKIAFNGLRCKYNNIQAHLRKSELEAKLTGGNRLHSTPTLSASIQSDAFTANADEDIKLDTKQFTISAKARYNARGRNFLLKWNPQLHFDMHKAEVDWKEFPQHVSVPQMTFDYNNHDFKIATSQIKLGKSDFSLTGEVQNIGKWLQKRDTLVGELNFVSEHTDVNQLLELFSADSGSEEVMDSTAIAAAEAQKAQKDSAAKQDGPFLVPQMVDLVLNTHIKEAVVFDETAYNLGGRVYVRNNTLVLEEMGFICNAAKLQLTAMYRTPRRNHIYLGLDYHMLDVDIAALIGMIPQLDTMIPMLKSFKGNAEFHLAAETYLNQNYEIKPSTLRGACSLFGKDLVVMDSETFDKISKILMFSKKTENKVDSISAELTLYKKEIDVYPFCVSIDNYMAAVGGRHNLDMSFNYHVNLLSPLYIGVDVLGTLDDLKIKPAKCVYAQDFRPLFHNKVDTQSAELRQLIRDSMRKNVKIK